jgi:hypothetical protein
MPTYQGVILSMPVCRLGAFRRFRLAHLLVVPDRDHGQASGHPHIRLPQAPSGREGGEDPLRALVLSPLASRRTSAAGQCRKGSPALEPIAVQARRRGLYLTAEAA